jgi:NitT/TauT family transport system ATP-binding protein
MPAAANIRGVQQGQTAPAGLNESARVNPATQEIVLRDVTKTFVGANGDVTEAVSGVSFSIAAGEFISVVGPSGCGKSTLLRMIAGLSLPSSGEVLVGGGKITGPHTNLGIVFQRDLLLETRTALQNVLLQVEMRGLRKRDYEPYARELLQRIGLKDFVDKYPRQLSGGMRQRVAICRALVHDAPLILMDEPFGALDALTREEITVDLARLCERTQKTVFFITHSISEAVFLSDRVFVMTPRPGRLARQITIEIPRPRSFREQADPLSRRYEAEIRSLLFSRDLPSQELKSPS